MARTLADLGLELPLVEVVVVADMALHARVVSLRDLANWLYDHPRWPGASRLRRVMALANPRAESPLETRLRVLLRGARLPEPVVQPPRDPNE